MRNLAKALVGLSALSFAGAVLLAFTGSIMHFSPGTLGRTSLTLSALAIAIVLVFDTGSGSLAQS